MLQLSNTIRLISRSSLLYLCVSVLAVMYTAFASAQSEASASAPGRSGADLITGNTRILVLGDSLSAAYNMKPEQGWVALLQQRLHALTDENASLNNMAYDVINASISGATTAAGLQLLPQSLTRHQPDIVIIELGGNDGLQGKPLHYIRRNLEQLVRLCKSSGAKVLLAGIHIPPNYGESYTVPFFNQYAEISQALDTAYLPFLLENIATKPRLMMADGIHPKPEAQPLIVDNIWPVLLTLISHNAKN